MKIYKFCVSNWKSPLNNPFWYYKAFHSAYYADKWAMKISFHVKNSPYMVSLIPGEEKPV